VDDVVVRRSAMVRFIRAVLVICACASPEFTRKIRDKYLYLTLRVGRLAWLRKLAFLVGFLLFWRTNEDIPKVAKILIEISDL